VWQGAGALADLKGSRSGGHHDHGVRDVRVGRGTQRATARPLRFEGVATPPARIAWASSRH